MDSLQEYLSKKFKRIQRRSYEGADTQDNSNSNSSSHDKIKRRDDYKCGYCLSERSSRTLRVDRIVDSRLVDKRGLTDLLQKLDNPGNNISACLPCYREKQRKGAEEFFYRHPKRLGNLLFNGRYVCDKVMQSLVSAVEDYSREKEAEEANEKKELFDVSEETI